ncbi:hypothetical protein KIH87_13625 [Paraneptunicella aestuarii]|uniref:hypothetical protein n=1 Tax=Paraneptunicella aestuarii TaxID=2831148 RepID=UPI001E28C8E1|nr:hypothetical protein [Paraneptunicella aestuarii]UAA37740.1 hypothetical protein KIH87_13625 [Paraneptunicella aestuarii]
MSSDLLFSVLPRLGKEPPIQDEHVVEQVGKEARLRELDADEKELNSEEREAREKYKKSIKKKREEAEANEQDKEEDKLQDHNYTDAEGHRHIDDFA